MRKLGILGFVGLLALLLAGCGGGGGPAVQTQTIDSSLSVDADITRDLGTGIIGAPFQASTVLAGVTWDAAGTPTADTRGFLNFSLGTIPLNASIRFASVTVFLNRVTLRTPSLRSPFFLDLIDTVAFPPPVVSADYSAPLAATRSFDFLNTDQGNFVEIEVTSLMLEAQRRALPSFELRIGFDEATFLADLTKTRGIVEIDEGTVVPSQRPFLTVDYVI